MTTNAKKSEALLKQKLKIINSTTASYIAGLIDGEGCVGIRSGKKKYKSKTYIVYYPFIQVGMCDRKPIQLLHRLFGGSIYYCKSRPAINRKGYYTFCVVCKDAVNLAKIIYHFSIVKKLQLRCILKFQKIRDESSLCKRISGDFPRRKISTTMAYARIKEFLNKKHSKNGRISQP